jgi:CheY-like chemotaxis protein
MPEMGGVEAGIKLLEICPGTKIVLVTESVPPETLEQLEAKGPSMTWAERTKAGVDAKHFQEALRAKS